MKSLLCSPSESKRGQKEGTAKETWGVQMRAVPVGLCAVIICAVTSNPVDFFEMYACLYA